MRKKTHYSSYDVMNEKNHWDDHTQQVVHSRLVRERDFQFFTLEEAEMLKRICGDLVGDQREDIIQYVVCHIDETLSSAIGEGQRKVGVPKGKVLIREGLQALNKAAEQRYFLGILSLDSHSRQQLLQDVSQDLATPIPEWKGIPQVELFKKLLTLSIEAYYSHPIIWSEIGYGGPAYPRGYVRTQLGQLDPWEAQPEQVKDQQE